MVFLGSFLFCKSWCRLRVLDPSQMNGGGKAGGGQRPRGWRRFKVLCVFQKGRGWVHFLALAPQVGGRQCWKSNPPPQMFTMPLGPPFWVGGGAVAERQALACSSRGSSESSERSHGMIKGK